MTRLAIEGLRLGASLALASLVAACSDSGHTITGTDSTAGGAATATVSDPVPEAAALARQGGRVAGAAQSAAASEVAYVSLPPGTIPDGALATIRNDRVGTGAAVHVVDGGFDPIPMPAHAGDSIAVSVTNAASAVVYTVKLKVPIARSPRIVRTIPPKRKRDVPLNASVVLVFSEPVDGATLSPGSIHLLLGTTVVAGTARFLDPTLDATHVSVAFVPDAPLAPNTEYRLVVTGQLRDLSGDALPAPDTASFTTGTSSTGAPARIEMVPDSTLDLAVGTTEQLRATVLDAAGNALTDQPVTWSLTCCDAQPDRLTLSPTGLLTGLAEGGAYITASVGEVRRGLIVRVVAAPPASVTLSRTAATVAAGDTIVLAATVRDAAGRVSRYPSVTWSSSAASLATVAPSDARVDSVAYATVTGVSQGSVTITATSGGASEKVSVTVSPVRPPASVTVTPAPATVIVQGTAQLTATLRDATGKVITGPAVTWTVDDATVARVDGNGVVTGVSKGSAVVTATSQGTSGTATLTVITLTFASVRAGAEYSCGVTIRGAVYCWGLNHAGQLGTGSTAGPTTCPMYYCSKIPAAVAGNLTFEMVAPGTGHTCGVTTAGAAYCWGRNEYGQLGNGVASGFDNQAAPVPVTGGLTFSTITVGNSGDGGTSFTCGITRLQAAYCWGTNGRGELGNGAVGERSATPVAVVGGLSFKDISADATGVSGAVLGLTIAGETYAWGAGDPVPTRLAGAPVFTSVARNYVHACGIAADRTAYCWGENWSGELGSGVVGGSSATPVPVTGGLTFSALTVGERYTCGVTTSGAAYCWGINVVGELGIGSIDDGIGSPRAVAGGLTFATISAGQGHTCGVTTDGVAYCWGANGNGQLGDGTTTSSTVPVKVAGQP